MPDAALRKILKGQRPVIGGPAGASWQERLTLLRRQASQPASARGYAGRRISQQRNIMAKTLAPQFRIEPGKRAHLGRRDPADARPSPTARRPRSRARRTARPSTSCRTGSTPKASARCWSCCRAPTRGQGRHHPPRVQRDRPARRHRHRLQARRARRNWRTISSGASISPARAAASSASSTARTTRTCWSAACASWRRRRRSSSATSRSTPSRRSLAENGTTILKFMLHISKDEQRERLQARLDEPRSAGSSIRGDLEDRKLWDEFQAAYELMLDSARPPGRPGTSSRPIANGRATPPSPRSCARRWRRWTRNIPSRTGTRRTSRSSDDRMPLSTSPPLARPDRHRRADGGAGAHGAACRLGADRRAGDAGDDQRDRGGRAGGDGAPAAGGTSEPRHPPRRRPLRGDASGPRVTATAEVTGVEGRTITFRVEARDEREVIGDGTHSAWWSMSPLRRARAAQGARCRLAFAGAKHDIRAFAAGRSAGFPGCRRGAGGGRSWHRGPLLRIKGDSHVTRLPAVAGTSVAATVVLWASLVQARSPLSSFHAGCPAGATARRLSGAVARSRMHAATSCGTSAARSHRGKDACRRACRRTRTNRHACEVALFDASRNVQQATRRVERIAELAGTTYKPTAPAAGPSASVSSKGAHRSATVPRRDRRDLGAARRSPTCSSRSAAAQPDRPADLQHRRREAR